MPGDVHVVFGAGQVGPHLAARLLAAGKRVRVVKRSQAGVPAGVEGAFGDAADAGFCAQATQDAAVVYHCMNPPYDRAQWARFVPVYMSNLITAAGKAGARLVVLDNVYMIGRTAGRPITEDTPANPVSAKGEIRAKAAQALLDAHRRGDVQAVTGRASDFYGPGGTGTHFGEQFWKPALAGKTVQMLIDPDAQHTYHYIPDVAAGIAGLGMAGHDVLGRVWLLPCAPAGTARDLVARFSRVLGREIKVARAPRLAVRMIGIFTPIVRELAEMLYQWDEPFVVDDRRSRERLGIQPTDADTAARATVEWARAAYGGAR
jgi:nucleoside-diphosphate-sugar epimerase